MQFYSFKVFDGRGNELSVSRNIVEAESLVEAQRQAQALYPTKVITHVHEMDFDHGRREYEIQEWDVSLLPLQRSIVTIGGIIISAILLCLSRLIPRRSNG